MANQGTFSPWGKTDPAGHQPSISMSLGTLEHFVQNAFLNNAACPTQAWCFKMNRKYLTLDKAKLLGNAFTDSQFNYPPLIWTFYHETTYLKMQKNLSIWGLLWWSTAIKQQCVPSPTTLAVFIYGNIQKYWYIKYAILWSTFFFLKYARHAILWSTPSMQFKKHVILRSTSSTYVCLVHRACKHAI